MKITDIYINGIEVRQEHGHYLLQKNGVQMHCGINELNESMSEFERYLKQAIRKEQSA